MESHALFEKAQLLVNEIVERKLNEFLVDSVGEKLLKPLMSIRYEKRLWLFNSVEDLQDFWELIRKDSEFCDFILTSTIEFKVRLTSEPQAYSLFVKHLSNSATCFSPHYREGLLAMDDDLYDRLPEPETFQHLLIANPWFVFTLVLTLSPLSVLTSLLNRLNEG
jgi:hypothetical protein